MFASTLDAPLIQSLSSVYSNFHSIVVRRQQKGEILLPNTVMCLLFAPKLFKWYVNARG